MADPRVVLIVEDEGLVARDIQNRLRRLGYDAPAWCTSGAEALRLAAELKPNLVLMDIQLKGSMDGIEAAEQIRGQLDIPVVFLTAHADAATLGRAKLTHPFGYLLKPFEEQDLQVTIELALFKHESDRLIAERDRWLATTLRSIGDAVIATDASGRVAFINPVAEKLTGWASAEASGRQLAEVFEILDEATGLKVDDPVARVLSEGAVTGLANHTLLRSRTGQLVPVGDSAAPIRDERGRTTGVVLVFRDLSQEREAQARLNQALASLQEANQELSSQKGFLSALFESIPSAVLVISPGNRVEIVNHVLEKTFGPLAGRLQELLAGDVLHCKEAQSHPGECGNLDSCQMCEITSAVRAAMAGRETHRRRAELRLGENGSSRSLVLLVTAAPLVHLGARKALLILEDVTELYGLRALIAGEKSFAGIVGRDRKMQEVYETIREVADVGSSVLIRGESGTGKELVARAIHSEGPRASRSFVPVNCGALPENLLETELFGHVRGAFTGAIRDKKGRFELADGGTIFLDEVGDLTPAMQVKLLRVLQEQSFERVGGERTIKVDVRIVSATNKDLRQAIAAGKFREDLFYRLCVVPIELPPLRERVNDIPLLAEHILEKVAMLSGRARSSITPEALAAIMEHSWPGNIRELQNVLEYALIKSKGGPIETNHLPAELRSHLLRSTVLQGRQRKATPVDLARALQAAGGNRARAAKLLGISRATLYRLLDEVTEPAGERAREGRG